MNILITIHRGLLFERLLYKREFQTDLTNTFIVMRYGDLIFLITFCIKVKSNRLAAESATSQSARIQRQPQFTLGFA